jgi:hypothetical protein
MHARMRGSESMHARMWGGLLQDTVSPMGDMVHLIICRRPVIYFLKLYVRNKIHTYVYIQFLGLFYMMKFNQWFSMP